MRALRRQLEQSRRARRARLIHRFWPRTTQQLGMEWVVKEAGKSVPIRSGCCPGCDYCNPRLHRERIAKVCWSVAEGLAELE